MIPRVTGFRDVAAHCPHIHLRVTLVLCIVNLILPRAKPRYVLCQS